VSLFHEDRLLVDGELVRAERSFETVNPSTGDVLGNASDAEPAHVDAAVAAARRAFDGTAWMRDRKLRLRCLRQLHEALTKHREDLRELLMTEVGAPRGTTHGAQLDTPIEAVAWYADLLERYEFTEELPAAEVRGQQHRRWVEKEAAGVVAAILPYNYPTQLALAKLAPALAAGCTVVIKGSPDTPWTTLALGRIIAEHTDIPAGVVNVLTSSGPEAGELLTTHPDVDMITFTGSTPVGKQLAALAGQHMKRATMELGGHAPVIVAEDADVALAVKTAGGAKFRNAGQVCISPTRFLVHESIRNDFAAALVKHAQGLKVGDGMADGIQMGPLANPRRLTAMAEFTQDAVERGARVAAGGERMGQLGNFWAPTVLVDVPLEAKVFNDEPFGPMAAIRSFNTLDEAIAEANRLPFGLAGYAYTRSLKNAHALSQRLEVGMLWINQPAAPWPEMPFGGLKDSGYGSEGGPEALEAYLNTRSVSIMNV